MEQYDKSNSRNIGAPFWIWCKSAEVSSSQLSIGSEELSIRGRSRSQRSSFSVGFTSSPLHESIILAEQCGKKYFLRSILWRYSTLWREMKKWVNLPYLSNETRKVSQTRYGNSIEAFELESFQLPKTVEWIDLMVKRKRRLAKRSPMRTKEDLSIHMHHHASRLTSLTSICVLPLMSIGSLRKCGITVFGERRRTGKQRSTSRSTCFDLRASISLPPILIW